MSLKSWREEFYPVKAHEVTGLHEALAHSLKKWEGLTPENLQRHGCSPKRLIDRKVIMDNDFTGDVLSMGSSCALCLLYLDHLDKSHRCSSCPLYGFRNGVACDEGGIDDQTHQGVSISPYQSFYRFNDPQPMIALLKAAVEFYKDIPK